MGKLYAKIDEKLESWIGRQRVFFVGTAPSGADGHVNVSPKGPIESLRVLDERTVAYLDFAGSGVETIAHLRENGRIVVMFCAFEGPPRIVRLHGRGSVVQLGEAAFSDLARAFDPASLPAGEERARAVVRVEVSRIADSCGYGVPLMHYEGERRQATAWTENRLRTDGPGAVRAYVAERNGASIDALPGIDPALVLEGEI